MSIISLNISLRDRQLEHIRRFWEESKDSELLRKRILFRYIMSLNYDYIKFQYVQKYLEFID